MNYYYNPVWTRGPWTSIVAAVVPDGYCPPDLPASDNPVQHHRTQWQERSADILDGLTKLFRQGDVEYYGYL